MLNQKNQPGSTIKQTNIITVILNTIGYALLGILAAVTAISITITIFTTHYYTWK